MKLFHKHMLLAVAYVALAVQTGLGDVVVAAVGGKHEAVKCRSNGDASGEFASVDFGIGKNVRGIRAVRLIRNGESHWLMVQDPDGNWPLTVETAGVRSDGTLHVVASWPERKARVAADFHLAEKARTVEGKVVAEDICDFAGTEVDPDPQPKDVPPLMDGTPWSERRAALLKAFEENEFGSRPVEQPSDIRFETKPDVVILDGKGVRRDVRISCAGTNAPFAFSAHAYLPRSARKVGVFVAIVLGGRVRSEHFDPNADNPSFHSCPIADIVGRGYGVVVFNNWDVAMDDSKTCFETGVFAAFGPKERAATSWGALSAWAWGASRVADWIETQPDLDRNRLAVVGHSRGGKAALWAGATDARFALVCDNASGAGGSKLNHIDLPASETLESVSRNLPHFFCPGFRLFAVDAEGSLYDQHMLLALIAPRRLCVVSCADDSWAGPAGQRASCRFASPAWESMGVGGYGECVRWHMVPGGHDLSVASWRYFMDAMDAIPAAKDCVAEKLPGEEGRKAAMSPDPFPDRMSAYVWRNWGLVEKERLAKVVGAKAEDLAAIAVQMGLAPDPVVPLEWATKGYITIVRRNWHLLPYDQLLALIGKTREEFRFSLMEDDFLWIKLGSVKPWCGPLRWGPGMVENGRPMREAIARALKEEGLDPSAPEEPRFAFVKDIAAPQAGFAMPESDGESPFGFRLIFSYFADYGDPLADPEIGSFPEGLLQKLAAEGVNAVWMHTVLRTLARDPKYPEFGEGSEGRIANLRKLVARCGKYGIRVFLYMNEPRAMPAAFFERNEERRSLRGAAFGDQFAMCTSDPEVLRWLRDSLEQVFSQVPGVGGIFTITMSENLTNCASRGGKGQCPRCRGRKTGDIVADVNCAMVEGMAKGSPDAEALVWNWQWPKDEEESIVNRLPRRNCRVMAVSENDMPICRGGVDERENDYSISIVGPGENALRLWGFAKARGIPSVAKVQAANSWELSSFPYIPAMDLVARHAVNIANEGVDGVMLSWSLGCCPSPNLSVYRELRKGERAPDALLDRMAARLYGAANVKRVRQAWKAFSDGFANYPFSLGTIYNGPHQWGPANPLYLHPTGYAATMVGIPYDDLDGWRSRYPRETYAELMGKVADGFAEGCRLLEGVAAKKELDMFRAEQMHFASCRDQALFIAARDRGDGGEMRRLAKAELERAKAYWPIVRADSRIGYESSNHYFFVPQDVLEKALSCCRVLDRPVAEVARNETAKWQAKIDAVAANGGGTVRMPEGRHFLSGLFLKSGVTLEIPKGCVVEGTTDILDYPDIHIEYAEIREPWQAIIAAVGQTNVAVVGEGEIFGNGGKFAAGTRLGRPRGMIFHKCNNVRVEGLTMRDLASWTCYFNECDGVVFRKVTVDSHANHNNDGVDIDARNVLVEDCEIDADDDGIVLKSDNPNFIVENVEVRNCEVRSCASLFKLGTASHGGFRNIRFHDCKGGKARREFIDAKTGNGFMSDYRVSVFPGSTVAPCPFGGMLVECVDGGLVEDVSFKNMTIRDCSTPIFVRAETRFNRKWGNAIPLGIPFGTGMTLRNVVFENVKATARSFTASSITGTSMIRPKDIRLCNVEIDMPGSGVHGAAELGRPVPEVEGDYPDPYMFAHRMLPACGFYIRHADNVTLENVSVNVRGEDVRPTVVCDDMKEH